MMTARRVIILGLASWLLTACQSAPKPAAHYYLVRHAEKILDVKDPDLTQDGHQRARDLAIRLKDVPLTQIYSSDYKRTQQTAAPLAAAKGLTVTPYNPRDLESFAVTLKSMRGHILIVGHSNTTPPLAEYLGGNGGKPIREVDEYDRLYIITHSLDGNARIVDTQRERYGNSDP